MNIFILTILVTVLTILLDLLTMLVYNLSLRVTTLSAALSYWPICIPQLYFIMSARIYDSCASIYAPIFMKILLVLLQDI